MHVWLIQVGEPLPSDPGSPRLLRTGLLAAELARRGHRVTWWATTFRHSSKTHRSDCDTVIAVSPRYRLMLMHSPGYSSNVSLARFRDHRALGRRFREWARQEDTPDLIHCGFPTIELAYQVAQYAGERKLPWVIDARDMWPDIYVDAVPSFLRPVARRLLRSDFDMTREAFRCASSITAHAPGFVEWGLSYADRSRRKMDRDFPFAYPIHPPTAEEVVGAEHFWIEKGLTGVANEFVICFFGTFTERKELDLETVLRTARELRQQLPQVTFVLCGSGPAAARYTALAAELGNVLLPGWVDYPQIWTLMRRAKVGILPYLPSADFIASMPNKSIEYLSAGLPVLTCLRGGYLQTVLEEGGCGIFYHGGTPGSLKDAIQHLVSDSGGLQTRRSAAARLFEQRFREDRVYSQMVDHLELVRGSDARGEDFRERICASEQD